MTWATAHASPHDRELDRAWEVANAAAAKSVPLRVQLRVTACVRDLLATVCLVRELVALETARAKTYMALSHEEDVENWRLYSGQLWGEAARLAAAVKALFMFARSFHDAAYAMLLSATGQSSGQHTSLAKGIKNPSSSLRKVLEQEIPNFVSWFLEARDIRNDMKLGISTNHGSRGSEALCEIRIGLQGITGDPPSVSTVRELIPLDVELLVEQSARFMKFVAQAVTSRSLPELRE